MSRHFPNWLIPEWEWVFHPNGFLKIMALATCTVSTRLFCKYATWPATPIQLYLCLVTSGGWILLLSFVIVGYALDASFGWNILQEMCADVVGVILHAVVACIIIDDYRCHRHSDRRSAALAYGSVSIVTSSLLALDAFCWYETITRRIVL